MKINGVLQLKEMWKKVDNYKMKKRDKKIFIEALTIMVIYFISFLILSLGRVQHTFLGIPENVFSSLQIITLTFFFAIVTTLAIYFVYKHLIT